MSGEVPINTGFEPQTIRGQGGIIVSGAGHVTVANGGPGGSGAVIQEVYARFSDRPTTLAQPAPGGPFVTLLTATITIGPVGKGLHIQAALSARVKKGGAPATFVKGAMRVLVDNVQIPGSLGATEDGEFGAPAGDSSISLSQQYAVPDPFGPPLTPGDHTVELQWAVFGNGNDPSQTISILDNDLDGASLMIREIS
jgi:hypothetical protein